MDLPHFFIYMEENMIEIEEGEGRVYELAHLFVPTLEESALLARFSELKDLLEKNGATFVSEDMPRMIDLAYEMPRTIENKKTWFNTAYFGWVKFEIEPAALEVIKAVLDRDETLIRYMIIKTVKENTIASKRPLGVRTGVRTKVLLGDAPSGEVAAEGETPAVEAPLDEEAVDKQIDAMITE